MTYEKIGSFRPLLESANQTHLTLYLENGEGLRELKRQLKFCLKEVRDVLEQSPLSELERKTLLLPVEALVTDTGMLAQLKGNIGIFRTRSSFRVLSVPVPLKRSCHVASTFHVKPLLRWMQWDSEFLILGLDRGSAHLFHGSQDSFRKIGDLLFPTPLTRLFEKEDLLSPSELHVLRTEAQKTFSRVSDWIVESLPKPGLKLFVAGEKNLIDRFMANPDYRHTVKTPIAPIFREEKLPEIVSSLRFRLRDQTRKLLEQALFSFRIADEMNGVEQNMQEIAQAAVQGKVRKLVIAENQEIYGRLDPRSGKLSVHPFDLDHEDDDLLDDLAQHVLISGGEVYLAKQEEIPGGRPILAVLEKDLHPAVLHLREEPREELESRYAV